MNNLEKLKRTGNSFFTQQDIANILGLSANAVAVYCSRAVQKGDLERIKRGFYFISGTEASLAKQELYKLATYLVTPSYISLQTALVYYELSTQIVPFTVESICLATRRNYQTKNLQWLFWQTKKALFFGFQKKDDIFIAEPEKAIIDIANLIAYDKYAIDLGSISFEKFDWTTITKWSKKYSFRTQKLLSTWRGKYERT